jgi:hypothetical protein
MREIDRDRLRKLEYLLLITRLVLSVLLVVLESLEIAALLLRYRGVT